MHHLRRHLKKFTKILLLISLLLLFSYLMKEKGLEGVISFMKQNRLLGLCIYFIYAVLAATITTFPVLPLWPVLYLVHGYWLAVVISLTASVTGATLAFLLTRSYGKKVVKHLVHPKFLAEIDHIINAKNSHSFLIFRIFADTYYDIVSYAAGLSKMKYHHFLIITLTTTSVWSLIQFAIIGWALQFDALNAVTIIGAAHISIAILGILVWKVFQHKSRA